MNSYQKTFNEIMQNIVKGQVENGKDIEDIDLSQKMGESVLEVIESTSESVLESFIKDGERMYADERSFINEYEIRLERKWRDALVLLQGIIKVSEESSIDLLESFLGDGEEKVDEKEGRVFKVLIKLHTKSIQISKEIFALLKAGFPDGALARWRSLHENNVVIWLLTNNFDNIDFTLSLIERFIDYSEIERAKELRLYKLSAQKLGLKEIDKETEREVQKNRQDILKKYGRDFAYPNMWAKPLFPNGTQKIEFHELEKVSGIDKVNPYYNQANQQVHSSPKGIYGSLSFMPGSDQKDFYLYGGSNYGLSLPIQLTTISLTQTTGKILTIKPNIDRLIIAKTLNKYSAKCNLAASEIKEEIEREEFEKENKEKNDN